MSGNHGRSEKAVREMSPDIASQMKALTDKAALADDRDRIQRYRDVLAQIGDDTLPDDDLLSDMPMPFIAPAKDNGSAGFLDDMIKEGALSQEVDVPESGKTKSFFDEIGLGSDLPDDLPGESTNEPVKVPKESANFFDEIDDLALDTAPSAPPRHETEAPEKTESFFDSLDLDAAAISDLDQSPEAEGPPKKSESFFDNFDFEADEPGGDFDIPSVETSHEANEKGFLDDLPEFSDTFSEIPENSFPSDLPKFSDIDSLFNNIDQESETDIGPIEDLPAGSDGWLDDFAEKPDEIPASAWADDATEAQVPTDAVDHGDIGDAALGRFAKAREQALQVNDAVEDSSWLNDAPGKASDEDEDGESPDSDLPRPTPFQSFGSIPGYEDFDKPVAAKPSAPSFLDEDEDGDFADIKFTEIDDTSGSQYPEQISTTIPTPLPIPDKAKAIPLRPAASQASFEAMMGIDDAPPSTGVDTSVDDENDSDETARPRKSRGGLIPFRGLGRRKKSAAQDDPDVAIEAEALAQSGEAEEIIEMSAPKKAKRPSPMKKIGLVSLLATTAVVGVSALEISGMVDMPFLNLNGARPVGQVQSIPAAPQPPQFGTSDAAPVQASPDPAVVPAPTPPQETVGGMEPASVTLGSAEITPAPAPQTDVTTTETLIGAPTSLAEAVTTDQAVSADPRIADLFNAGTTVVVKEETVGPDQNVVRVAEALDEQRARIEGAENQLLEIQRAIGERDDAMLKRDEAIKAAMEIAQRAESIALAQNEILVRVVQTEEVLRKSSEVMQDLSHRVASVEANDTVTIEVDRLTSELKEQKRDIEALARSMIANNSALEQRKRELNQAAALAARKPAPPPSMPVPEGSGTVYGTGGNALLELPGSGSAAIPPVVPDGAKKGDIVPGYGTIEEISDVENGQRLIITENGSFVVK